MQDLNQSLNDIYRCKKVTSLFWQQMDIRFWKTILKKVKEH